MNEIDAGERTVAANVLLADPAAASVGDGRVQPHAHPAGSRRGRPRPIASRPAPARGAGHRWRRCRGAVRLGPHDDHFFSDPDPAFHLAGVQAYNNWLAEEIMSVDPTRLIGPGCIPALGVTEAIREMERCLREHEAGEPVASAALW